MLLDLNVLNGEFSPTFDIYVDTYTVSVEEDVDSLVLNYEVEDGASVKVINNENLSPGDNFVYLEVTSEKGMETYTLEVYKKQSSQVFNYEEYVEPLAVEKTMPSYGPFLIIGSCCLVIIITFLLLFKKKKK